MDDVTAFTQELAVGRISMRIAWGWRVMLWLVVLLMFSAAIFLICEPFVSGWSGSNKDYGSVVAGFLILILGVGLLLSLVRTRLVIEADRLRLVGAFFSKEIAFSQVEGLRLIPAQYVSALRFVAVNGLARDVEVTLLHKRNKEFVQWAYGRFEDLDAREVVAELDKLQNDASLGDSADKRMSSLQRGRLLSRWYVGACIVLGVWCLVYPRPYVVALLICLFFPLVGVALMLLNRGAICIDSGKHDVVPSIGSGLVIVCMAPLARGARDWEVLNLYPLVLPALVPAVILAAFFVLADPKLRAKKMNLIGFTVLAVLYGFGLAYFVNGHFDHATPQRYTREVYVEKHSGDFNHLAIVPPAEFFDEESLLLTERVKKRFKEGDRVDLVVWPGRLGAAYYFFRNPKL